MIELNCPKCGKTLRIPPEYRGLTGRCNGCGGPVAVPVDALTMAQESVVQRPTNVVAEVVVPPLPVHDWRNEPASERQLSSLAELGATPTQMRGLNKGQASELIEILQCAEPSGRAEAIVTDMANSQRQMAKAQNDLVKAANRHTNWQKNACGCIVLLLMAPIWIPSCLYIIGSASPHSSGSHIPSSRSPSNSGYTPRSAPRNELTLAKFNQLREGMSYQQVVQILGKEGTVMSESTIGSGQFRTHTIYVHMGGRVHGKYECDVSKRRAHQQGAIWSTVKYYGVLSINGMKA